MRRTPLAILALLLVSVSGCEIWEVIQERKYRDLHLKLEKANQDLQIRLLETQAVANNLPRFQEEINKVCKGKEVDVPKVNPTRSYQPKIKASLPAFYIDVPPKFQREDLVQAHLSMKEKLSGLTDVIRKVEYFKRLKATCKNSEDG